MTKNFYAIGNESLDQFLRADGSWADDIDDAEHFSSIEDAVMKQVELIQQNIITEICEVPLMHEAVYEDIHSRIDDLQARLESAGIHLSTTIGSGDDTTWTIEIESAGVTLTLRLAGPDEWEARYEN